MPIKKRARNEKPYLNISMLMLKYNVKQSEITEYLKISISAFSQKINGRYSWTQVEMYKICDFFNELDPEKQPTPYENLHLLFPIKDYKGK